MGNSIVLDRLDGFCDPVSPFWRRDNGRWVWPLPLDNRSNATGWQDNTDLPLCFQDTAILYSILVLFWLLSALKFLCGDATKPSVPFSWLNVIKSFLSFLMIIFPLVDLIYTIVQGAQQTPGLQVAHYQYLTPIVMALSMGLAALLNVYERKNGTRSSGLLIVLWLSLVVWSTIKLRTYILKEMDAGYITDSYRFGTFIGMFAFFIIQMFLSFISEPKSPYMTFVEDGRQQCPEESAPFFSRITWWWMTSLIWIGWRRSLTYDDLYDLNYEDKSRVVAPRFQKEWDRQLKNANVRFEGHQLEEQPGVEVRQRQKDPSLVMALIRTFGPMFIVAAFFKLLQDALQFVSPQILKLIISYINDQNEPEWQGYFYAVLLFITAVLQSLFLHQYFHRCFLAGMRIRTAVISTVYRKAMKLSNRARRTRTVGEIVNLMSVDAQRFMDLMTYIHMLWSAPLQIVISMVFLYISLGWPVFIGLVVMVLMIPLNMVIALISRKFQVTQMLNKDSRIKLVNEVLNGIKVIKLYAWEIPFKRQIMNIRGDELRVLKYSAYLSAGTSFTWTCAPFLVSLSTFATFALAHQNDPANQLTAERVFVALSLFNILRFPLAMLPMLISSLVEVSVSVKRLREFLKGEELDPDNTDWRDTPPMGRDDDSVTVIDGSFTWESPDRPSLENINLHIKPGELVAVVGHVGAGKSSLISALLGEMEKMNGHVALRGNVAFVPQQAWIQNATVKDNILFGKQFSGRLYNKTLQECALESDLEILPGGDMTEIGEKGINLSGGQKQRVSLARAVYQEADIYLLDDPLSAVDSHVGKHIFDKVIGPDGMLRGKVRILVTHGLGFLPQCDRIVVMDDGKVTESGAYAELMDNNGAFAEFIRHYSTMEENEEGDPFANEYSEYDDEILPTDQSALTSEILSDNPDDHSHKLGVRAHITQRRAKLKSSDSVDDPLRTRPELVRRRSRNELKRQLSKQLSRQDSVVDEKPTERTKLIAEETVETGTVRWSVLITYCKACTYLMTALMLLFNVLQNGASVGTNFWLAAWSNANTANSNVTTTTNSSSNMSNSTNTSTATDNQLGMYLGVYAGLGFGQAFLVLVGSFAMAIGSIKASKTLHDNMLANIIRSPMTFFDTTPLGRILNRFSKDIYTIDELVPRSLRMFIYMLFSCISTFVVICVASPWFLVIVVPLLVIYFLVQRFYVATSRQLKRLESVTRSPIYSHFQESVTGVSTIRAYRLQERFIDQNEYKIDYNQLAYYPNICSNRWLAIRLEFLGNCIILFAALFAVLQRNFPHVFGGISPGVAGLSLTYALQVTVALNWVVRMTSELETNIVAVERTKEYTDTPREAPPIVDGHRPPRVWPVEGKVQFDRYSTRYREGLDLVLKEISCDIRGGEKVGIVGRTGAGKSSLTVALFRIIEAASGAILIDGEDIATYGLDDLRSRITIIPQDPVLFSGTLRNNLDPVEEHTDEQLWQALTTANLQTFVAGLTEGLQFGVSEGGENLSVGQRQLVCLARALLRKTKILVLDEATAAVDMETDDLIQKTIRTEFADSTVLTIAHRLNTILDYDRVMVLDAGRIVEFDSPNKLIEEKGVFFSMARDAGLV